jgi:uncharacterized protein (DUF433 family)
MSDASLELSLDAVAPPLRWDEERVLRIGGTRLTLDLLVEQYHNGMSPEEIVGAYDSLQLTDVYAAIAYYLSHQDAVSEYLDQRNVEVAKLRNLIEAERSPPSRDELLTRRIGAELSRAAPGE